MGNWRISDTMPGIKSFLSKRDKEDLVRFVAQTGENYDRYLEWCNKRNAKPFSKGYFHQWIQRRRSIVQEERLRQKEEVRRLSMYDRQRRLEELERVSEYILEQMDWLRAHELCRDSCKPLDSMMRLVEQHRRQMEAISKERGEWNKPDQQPNAGETRSLIAMRQALTRLNSGKEVVVINQKVESEIQDMEYSEGDVGE